MLLHRTLIKSLAPINCIIQYLSFLLILLLNLLQPTLLQQLLKHQPAHVNAIARRSVVQRSVLNMNLVIKHHRSNILRTTNQIIPHYHNCDTSGPHILLCTSIDDTEP
ncbi:hypothetical protein V8G54_004493 [Vigna mungo]|uniref:Uncharacterized protein n=1 Tax=Vigna mungo TaxID=3915 RepID=A0AAQ3PFK0_VIGMU